MGEKPGSWKQPVPYLWSNAEHEAAIACGVGFFPVRTQASSADMELAYSELLSSLCSLSRVNVCASSVPVGALETGPVGGLVLDERGRVVDRVHGENGDGHPAGEVAVVGEVAYGARVGREPLDAGVERPVVVGTGISYALIAERIAAAERLCTMSRKVNVANRRCDSSVRSGIFVTARMSSRLRCCAAVRSSGSEAYPVHS